MQNMPVACFEPWIYALCAYTVGKALYEDGALIGTLKAVRGMMKNMGVSLEKAMDTLEITGEERDAIEKEINKW